MTLLQLIPFTEDWAARYKPMLHQPDSNKRFYCIESIAAIGNLAKELPDVDSPLVCMETNIGGYINDKFLLPEYNVYFFVRSCSQTLQDNDRADTQAKEEAMRHAIAYLAYLREEQQRLADSGEEHSVAGIDTDNIRFETFGPMFNRWFAVGISMQETAKLPKCVNPNDYV